MRKNLRRHLGGRIAHRNRIQAVGFEEGDQCRPIDIALAEVDRPDIEYRQLAIEIIGFTAGHVPHGGIEQRWIGFMQDCRHGDNGWNFDL